MPPFSNSIIHWRKYVYTNITASRRIHISEFRRPRHTDDRTVTTEIIYARFTSHNITERLGYIHVENNHIPHRENHSLDNLIHGITVILLCQLWLRGARTQFTPLAQQNVSIPVTSLDRCFGLNIVFVALRRNFLPFSTSSVERIMDDYFLQQQKEEEKKPHSPVTSTVSMQTAPSSENIIFIYLIQLEPPTNTKENSPVTHAFVHTTCTRSNTTAHSSSAQSLAFQAPRDIYSHNLPLSNSMT